jgi:hypothetical protein
MTEITTLVPPMTFRIQDVMSPEAFTDGPFCVFWNAEGSSEYVEPSKPIEHPPVPKVSRLKRMLGFKPWYVDIRVTPPPEQSLADFGRTIGSAMDLPVRNEFAPEDKAIWMPGLGVYRNAGEALGGTARLIRGIEGILVSSVQVRVEAVR